MGAAPAPRVVRGGDVDFPAMRTRLLLPVALIAVLALLAGCGGTGSSRSAEGAYQQLSDATSTMAGKGATYALIIQDCTATAKDAAAASACATQLLDRLKQDFAPIGAAIGALDKVADGTCQAALRKAVDDAPLLGGKDASPVTSEQGAEALGNQVADQLQQFAQEIAAAGGACT